VAVQHHIQLIEQFATSDFPPKAPLYLLLQLNFQSNYLIHMSSRIEINVANVFC
jgi:hypothetical protein